MKKYVKYAVLAVVAGIFIWTFVFLWQKSQPEVTVYQVVSPVIADLEKTTVITGKVEPRDEVEIKPQISGIIDVLYKDAGQMVKKDEVIAKVKVIPELGTLNSAESRLRLAEINGRQAETDFARLKQLYADSLISAEEYEQGEVAVRQAREETQAAADNLQIVKEGMLAVCEPGGTAASVFSNYGITIAAKTGTAENPPHSDNLTFIAYGPYEDPEIAVAVVLEYGGSGTYAMNVAKDIFDAYFAEELGGENAASDAQPA